MKTAYKPHIISPFQVKRKNEYDVRVASHPVQELINSMIGTYNLSASFEEDRLTLETFQNIPGLVAFLCTLKKGNEIIALGRGTAVISKINRFAEKLIKTAFHSSLVDAIVKSKMMDINIYSSTQTYDEPITERQKSYLLELIQNVDDDEERERLMSQIDDLTKEEASNAIQSLAK